jgi:hypothetical protein
MRFGLLVSAPGLAISALPAPGGAPQPKTFPSDTANLKKKVDELERQLTELRKEVRDLRQQLQSSGEANAGKGKSPVAWGKATNGLQAGLALRPADEHSYQVGELVRFVVNVRNVSDRPIEMPYLSAEPGARVGPSVLDADGKRPPMSGPAYTSVGGRAVSKLALAAGQEVDFAAPQLVLGPTGERRVQARATIQGGPGKYQVRYHVYYLNADNTGNYLTTGGAEVTQSNKGKP